jgi:hypothetical protein
MKKEFKIGDKVRYEYTDNDITYSGIGVITDHFQYCAYPWEIRSVDGTVHPTPDLDEQRVCLKIQEMTHYRNKKRKII